MVSLIEEKHFVKENSFVSKLSDSESETAETQLSLDFSLKCKYIDEIQYNSFIEKYNNIIGRLVTMPLQPENWCY